MNDKIFCRKIYFVVNSVENYTSSVRYFEKDYLIYLLFFKINYVLCPLSLKIIFKCVELQHQFASIPFPVLVRIS